MNFLSTGVKEISRRVRRQKNRLAMANARKTLDRAETALGLHGWRELVPDESVRETIAELHRLNEEVEAAHLRISELESRVREHEGAREAARREHEHALAALEEEREPFQKKLSDLQTRLAEHSTVLHEQNVRKTALHAEQLALLKEERRTRRKSLLLSEEQRDQRRRQFDEQRAALAEQAAQLLAARSTAVEPMVADEHAIKEVKNALAAFDQRAEAAGAELSSRERAAAVAIAGLHREIAAIRRQAGRIEDEKEGPFLALGRQLSARPQPPPAGDELHATARRNRQIFERLAAQEAASVMESREADHQDLRIFKFVGFTLAVVLAIGLLLFFRTPSKRDWLPANTEALLAVDVRSFTDADFTRALETREPDAWQAVWTGLLRTVADVPEIDVRRQVARITRAVAPADAHGPAVDGLLIQMRGSVDLDSLIRTRISSDDNFKKRFVDGLALYEKSHVALAQIGPDTLALGGVESVEALIKVRLGVREDLKSDAQFFSEFQRLDENSPFRLVTYRPRELTYLTDTLLNPELLDHCNALGLTIDVREPVSAVFILGAPTALAAGQIAHQLQASPDQVLQLASAGPNLFIEPPSVSRARDLQVEWRFRMTAPAAREFLERVTRLELTSTVAPKVADRDGGR